MLSQFENRLNTGQAVVVTVLIPNVEDKLGGGGSGNREALFDAGEVKGAEKAAAHKESTLAAHNSRAAVREKEVASDCRRVPGRSDHWKLIFRMLPLFPTNHPACGLAKPTAQ